MQYFVILLGIVLVASGLYFAVGGFGQGKSGGGFRGVKIEGPPWLLLVAIGVGLVIFGAVWQWGDDTAPQTAAGASPGSAGAVDVPTFVVDGLTWTTDTEIAGAVDWAEANAYCEGLNVSGLSFRLPTIGELQSIADPDDPDPFDRKILRIFHDGVDSNWIWSSDEDGAGAAFAFDFESLSKISLGRNFAEGAGALCVGS